MEIPTIYKDESNWSLSDVIKEQRAAAALFVTTVKW